MLMFFIAGIVGIVSIFLFAFLCFIAGTIAYIVEDNRTRGRSLKDSYVILRKVHSKDEICFYGLFVLFLLGAGFVFCALGGMIVMSILGF